MFRSLARRARALFRPWHLPIFYDRRFRLPLPGAALPEGIEIRRADYVAWYLVRGLRVAPEVFRSAAPISFRALRLVHTAEHVERLLTPKTLADAYAALPGEVSVDDVLTTVRVACGATVEAAELALRLARPVLNLLGGFHHAKRDLHGPLCPVNDIAVAVAVARERGFAGAIAVLDLDAHPPDGTADCFADDLQSWIGSISGSDWGPLPGNVDEVLLPPGTGDADYLRALDRLLARLPRADLTFVIAGGDVRQGDTLGALALTDEGIRERDRRVHRALAGRASVWLPGGGYSKEAWRTLTRTALVLAGREHEPIDPGFDPLAAEFAVIHRELGRPGPGHRPEALDLGLTEAELGLGIGASADHKTSTFLGHYNAQSIEFGLERYGILEHIARLGYRDFRIEIDHASVGERVRLFGRSMGVEHLLVEFVAEIREIAGHRVLFVHWMTMRNPRARFSAERPRLPGQEVPGLGLGREAALLIAGMGKRLGLDGGAFRPSWYHMAYAARRGSRFVEPRRQGRFEALVRDVERAGLSLLEATQAVADGRVTMNGQPYDWEADEMIMGIPPADPDRWHAAVVAEADHVHFEIAGAQSESA